MPLFTSMDNIYVNISILLNDTNIPKNFHFYELFNCNL